MPAAIPETVAEHASFTQTCVGAPCEAMQL